MVSEPSVDLIEEALLPTIPVSEGSANERMFSKTSRTLFDIWQQFFPPTILHHILDHTNARLRDHREKLGTRYHQYSMEELLNFFCIYNALSLVRYRHMAMAWNKPSIDWPFGSDFISSTMSRDRYLTLHRNIQADLPTMVANFNECAKKLWHLGTHIAFDDDLVQSLARTSKKLTIYNPKKAGKRGVSSCRIVDQSKYVYFIVFENDIRQDFAGELLYTGLRKLHLKILKNNVFPFFPVRARLSSARIEATKTSQIHRLHRCW